MSRLSVPTYQVSDAARYADISTSSIRNWQKLAAIAPREHGDLLSYLQLIEIAVIAAMRKTGVPFSAIREAKNYLSRTLNSDHPFALHCFKTDGKKILMDLSEFDVREKEKLIDISHNGQLGWNSILKDKLQEFEYHKETGIVQRWHIQGPHSPIVIDPQISFGAPAVKGIPTWSIKARLDAGESIAEIADDFSIETSDVSQALRFEGVELKNEARGTAWSH